MYIFIFTSAWRSILCWQQHFLPDKKTKNKHQMMIFSVVKTWKTSGADWFYRFIYWIVLVMFCILFTVNKSHEKTKSLTPLRSLWSRSLTDLIPRCQTGRSQHVRVAPLTGLLHRVTFSFITINMGCHLFLNKTHTVAGWICITVLYLQLKSAQVLSCFMKLTFFKKNLKQD